MARSKVMGQMGSPFYTGSMYWGLHLIYYWDLQLTVGALSRGENPGVKKNVENKVNGFLQGVLEITGTYVCDIHLYIKIVRE